MVERTQGRTVNAPERMAIAGAAVMLTVVMVTLSSFYVPDRAVVLSPWVAVETYEPRPYVIPSQYVQAVHYWADYYGVPHWLLARLLAYESTGDPMSGRWNPRAVSWLGAEGLAQIMPENVGLFSHLYKHDQPFDPFDPNDAIMGAAGYLADQRAESLSWRVAVMAYNGGIGHWRDPQRYGPWREESVTYVREVVGK